MARFTIQEYNRFSREILVETVDGRQWAIQEPDFEKYLQRNGLLDWELNYADHEGKHIQETGTMDIDDYFEQDKRYIKPDLLTLFTNIFSEKHRSLLLRVVNEKLLCFRKVFAIGE
jgi:hypothetical protein